ncbi:MAG: hypothetical protein EON50_18580 [Acidovorax sp.]|nr:MAG: hypothetical protein EON50_18580 [Acidovorax sp.]
MVHMALAWLLLALVAVPTLGRLHQVAHGGALDRVHAGQALAQGGALAGASAASSSSEPFASAAVDAAAQATSPAHSRDHGHGHESAQWLPLLLAGHAPVDCLLLDQLALGDTLHSAPVALPPAVPAHALPTRHAGRIAAAHVALFQARGPPRA